ncbi:MAG: response regulator [Eubacteriales bacterium]|nr:response regulator [Eubacteriales bacterium]
MYRVFLADDEPWVLLGLQNLIDWRESGFVICGEATDGVKAWERICNTKPDLIISDIQMPGLDGIELISRVREAKLDAEVVIISGYSEFEYARAGLQYGCADYLLKPVYEEELLSCLKKVEKRLNRRRLNEEGDGGTETEGERPWQSEGKTAQEMLVYLRKHYATVTQQLLAENFGMSVSAVSQIIKKNTGKSYSDHLLEARIQKAQQLLKDTDRSIEEIAEQVGYGDYFYFMKVFKKATGISPSAYRRSL